MSAGCPVGGNSGRAGGGEMPGDGDGLVGANRLVFSTTGRERKPNSFHSWLLNTEAKKTTTRRSAEDHLPPRYSKSTPATTAALTRRLRLLRRTATSQGHEAPSPAPRRQPASQSEPFLDR
ncbi:hypothetical protein E2C01_071685 [Portunus trituberculatus]|uniref:Uncharacterized protein n=1 Tax=Portunus trituberculatus TaxID=210409 RepID=A0A5B7I6V4_PORTR|nr:hypothetical protein [Portunus trituberculatus]